MSAENLVSGNWLLAAVSKAQAVDDDRTVFHPEYRFEFGPHPRVTAHVDERNPAFRLAKLFDADCWPGVCLAERTLLLDIPFAAAKRDAGWGYADWHWNCEVIAAGGAHHVVPGTVHFVRGDVASANHPANKANSSQPAC